MLYVKVNLLGKDIQTSRILFHSNKKILYIILLYYYYGKYPSKYVGSP